MVDECLISRPLAVGDTRDLHSELNYTNFGRAHDMSMTPYWMMNSDSEARTCRV